MASTAPSQCVYKFHEELIMDLRIIKRDINRGIKSCSERGLYQSVKWLSELNYAIKDVKCEQPSACSETTATSDDCGDENEQYLLAKSYFDVKEYDRCAYFVKDCVHPKARFLHYYTKYLSIEKKKLDNMTDATCPPDPAKNQALKDLNCYLKADYADKKLDGYGLYMYGVILKKLDLIENAIDVFVESVHDTPLLWASWQELSLLITNRKRLQSIVLPNHWIKQFFLAHAYLEQLNNDEALQICLNLQNVGFENSSYLLAQTAIIYHNRRDLEMAIQTFKQLLENDPYRLDNLDTYSNLLYVKELKSELADLAQTAVAIDKYRLETCCVIGNYYSLRSDHPKAVLYFQRALKLNPYYLSAWTLMGHEYMEMKNTNAAIQSYRQAISINKRDYRAWYGLGQTYEILKMHSYSLYYYKQSQQLRPNDSRMIIALGETYERLAKIENAIKCYHKACRVGDVERIALIKLAKLYDKLGMCQQASKVYTEYISKENSAPETMPYEEQVEYYNALEYLANTHLEYGRLDEAYNCAYKCLEHDETKDQARALLKSIAAKRGEQEPVVTVGMEETENMSMMSMDETAPGATNNTMDSNMSMEDSSVGGIHSFDSRNENE